MPSRDELHGPGLSGLVISSNGSVVTPIVGGMEEARTRSPGRVAVAAPDPTAEAARRALEAFVAWLDRHGELSQDPHDVWATGLGTRAKSLYYAHRLLGTVAVSPFVLLDLVAPRARSLLRPPSRSPIADAHYALGLFALARTDGDASRVERGGHFLAELERSRSPMFEDPGWGYPFDWPSRFGVFRAGTPLVTTMPYCYEAFDAGYAALSDASYLETMEGVARLVAERIPVTKVGHDAEAAAYSPFDRRRVVNASAYRGFLLTAAGHRFEREDWLEAAGRNVAFVLHSQRKDGSWPYSLDEGDDFVDNFHTCLVLKNLAKIWALEGSPEVRAAVDRGYAYYLDHLLDGTGLPVPFAHSPRLTLHRRDLYDYAEGINLARLLRDEIPPAGGVLRALVHDLVERWALPDGHFTTRELVVGRQTLPYHRWAQSQAFHALAHLVNGGD